MIMCEWHQHHHSQQTDGTFRFALNITFRFATKHKMPIFRPKNNIKITRIYRLYLIQTFVQK